MRRGDLIAVYGTLRSDASNGQLLASGAKRLGMDKISGQLFQLGWFPGLKTATEGEVVVEVHEIEDEALPDSLDSYEGYPSLYGRHQVTTAEGRTVWVYEYNGNVDGRPRIESGDWATVEG